MSWRIALRPGAAAIAALALACGGSGGPMSPPPSADLDADGLADLEEEALLRQFRPVWDFDQTETLFPISLEEWAALGERVVDADGSESAPYSDVESLLAAVQAFPGGVMITREEPYAGFPPCGAGSLCNDAPVFVDAIPVGFSLNGRDDLVWLHYWLFYHYDLKQPLPGSEVRSQHHGDWEHVCVLVSLDDLGDPDAPPVGLHYHAHGGLAVHDAASAWHSDDAGSFHPHVYVEASGHASYRDAGETLLGPHAGGRIDPDGLTHPLVFLRPHGTNRSDPADEILGGFRGRWGQTEGNSGESPIGPLEFNQPCDHDWKESPGVSDWLPVCAT
ncbi:MAG TPA: hypothetical protein VJ788_03395 [Gemmatimonadota bacterium]|nr:hypothetical protein [Gemmatimonadota bacterium]